MNSNLISANHHKFTIQNSNRKRNEEAADGVNGDLATAIEKPKLKKPRMFKIILLNDDFTPMKFVVHVLELFFSMHREKAIQIMLAVHTTGRAVCGTFPKDVAASKSIQINNYAQQNQHPLISQIEVAD